MASEADETFTVTFVKSEELSRACFGFKLYGGFLFSVGAAGAAFALYDALSSKIEYEAVVMSTEVTEFEKGTGKPIAWDVTFAKKPSGERFTHKIYRGGSEKDDVVVFEESKKGGPRRIRERKSLIPMAAVFLSLGAGFLYMGFSGDIPSFYYWPPKVRA